MKRLFKVLSIMMLVLTAAALFENHAKAAGTDIKREDAKVYTLENKASGQLKENEKEYYKFKVEKNACVQLNVETGSHYQRASMSLADGSGHVLDYYETEDPNYWGVQIFDKTIALAAGEYYLSIGNWYNDGDVSYIIDSKIVAEDTDQVRIAGIGNEYLRYAHPFDAGNILQSITTYTARKDCHRYKLQLKKDQTIVLRAKAELGKKQKLVFRMYDANGDKMSVKSTKLKGYLWNVKVNLKKGTYYLGIQANSEDIPYTVYTAAAGNKITGVKAKSPAKKQMKVTWKKSQDACDGYEVQYCLRKTFRGSKVYKATVKSPKTVSLKKKGLYSRYKYYVRVRSYQKLDGQNIYGAWSSVKSVKIK